MRNLNCGTNGPWRERWHSRGTWGEESSPTHVPDGIDPSPGGVLVFIHHHMAFGIHLHTLPLGNSSCFWQSVLGGMEQAMSMGDPCWWPLCYQPQGDHGGNIILWQALETYGTPETCGSPDTQGASSHQRNHLTTLSRHRSWVLGSLPTAHSRQSTS